MKLIFHRMAFHLSAIFYTYAMGPKKIPKIPWWLDATFPTPWAPKKSNPWRVDVTFPPPWAPIKLNPWRVDVTFPPPWAPKKSYPWWLDVTFPTPWVPNNDHLNIIDRSPDGCNIPIWPLLRDLRTRDNNMHVWDGAFLA